MELTPGDLVKYVGRPLVGSGVPGANLADLVAGDEGQVVDVAGDGSVVIGVAGCPDTSAPNADHLPRATVLGRRQVENLSLPVVEVSFVLTRRRRRQ